MNTRILSGTTLELSSLCFGTGSLGTGCRGVEADKIVGDYLEAGGNFFDTAHCYAFWEKDGLGASERELGDCLRRLGKLDKVVIATKGGHPDNGEDYRRPDDFLSERIVSSDIDESLNRLQMDTIDLYYLHRDDTRVPVETIIDMLNREINRGRIRYIGASNWSVDRIAEANLYAAENDLHGFVISQVQWSLAVPKWKIGAEPTMRYVTYDEKVFHSRTQIPIAAYSATSGGYFSKNAETDKSYANPVNIGRHQRANQLAHEMKVTPTQIALAYLLSQDFPVFPVFGTSDRKHLAEIMAADQIRLTAEQCAWLIE